MIQQAAFLFDFAADKHVFIHGQIVDQVQLLMDKRDARIQRLRGSMKLHGRAVQRNRALIGLQNAAQDIHQRAFARAVFTQQGADFALVQMKIHGLEHVVCPEGFVDAAHGKIHGVTSVLRILNVFIAIL